jgi:hypothetical protein
VDPATTLSPLAQYGAVGVILAAVLAIGLAMFKQFVNNMIEANRELSKQNFDMQLQNLTALNSIKDAITAMKTELSTDIRELDHTVSNMFNELSAVTGGSRGYAIGGKPPRPRQG